MKAQSIPCDEAVIVSMIEGRATADEEIALQQHLEDCQNCCRRMIELSTEGLLWEQTSQFFVDDELDAEASGGRSRSATGSKYPVNEQAATRAESTRHGDCDAESLVSLVLDRLAPTDDPAMLGRIGGYEVSGVVGSGGMGVVLKAHDRSLDRIVAIKVMAPHLASSGTARRRFAREAKAAAAVLHPNVIAIHGVSNDETLPYLVMPYVRGQSLQKRIDDEGPLALKDTLRIGIQIAAGLAAAHEQGLVHRDIKPANVLLEDGVERVAITDFGLARAVDDASMTRSGVIAGTPQYMSPEQARGESLDARSDLFSLGSVLYAMCTGYSPFRAETSYGVLHRITHESPRPVHDINSDVPAWLSRLIQRLQEKTADRRFQSASQIEQLLTACIAHLEQPDRQLLPAELRDHARRQLRWPAAALAGGLLVVVMSIVIALVGGNDKGQSSSLPGNNSVSDAGPQAAESRPQVTESQPQAAESKPRAAESQTDRPRHEPGTGWDDFIGTSAAEIQALATELEIESRSPFPSPETEDSPATAGDRS